MWGINATSLDYFHESRIEWRYKMQKEFQLFMVARKGTKEEGFPIDTEVLDNESGISLRTSR